ncbi:Aste57867_24170 [Aphanomyces stellatus]|uniref:Aste57867_24170 protein n=1 Tax=Aphanomyces stellatus TaxID=120398 RepID=A0A485LPL1_9STRA|nr:hypothetical protein As57867_024096 [Aphanomyces stellatus]VFU00812.1 Aste57867_24170 [Aphanomyces stellatus]
MNDALIRDRWTLEALRALRKRDSVRLKSVFHELPNAKINTTVIGARGGAPFDFGGEGFFDSRASSWATPSFKLVKHGDTLLTIALREEDPLSALALVEMGADINLANCDDESPLKMVWNVSLALQDDNGGAAHAHDYARLFAALASQLQ